MKKWKKLAGVASTAVLTLALSVPAYAAVVDTGDGEYQGTLDTGDSFNTDTVITASVSVPDAKVISVTVPSTMAIPIATKTSAGKAVFDADKTPSVTAAVTNNAKSEQNVKAEVSKVTEKPATTGGALLSTMVNLSLAGENPVLLKDGVYTSGNVLASSLVPGASQNIVLSAAEITGATVAEGDYTLATTIKVTAM